LGEPVTVAAAVPSGEVAGGEARTAAGSQEVDDGPIGQAVAQAMVDEVAQVEGETGDFAEATAGGDEWRVESAECRVKGGVRWRHGYRLEAGG